MPSLASLSIRGVGVVPPYTPKSPQPTLSTKMKTILGVVFSWRDGFAELDTTFSCESSRIDFRRHYRCTSTVICFSHTRSCGLGLNTIGGKSPNFCFCNSAILGTRPQGTCHLRQSTGITSENNFLVRVLSRSYPPGQGGAFQPRRPPKSRPVLQSLATARCCSHNDSFPPAFST